MLIENETYCQADPRITLADYPRFTVHRRQLELMQNISASKKKRGMLTMILQMGLFSKEYISLHHSNSAKPHSNSNVVAETVCYKGLQTSCVRNEVLPR